MITASSLINLTVSLLPVLVFLLGLVVLDSFKLLRPRTVIQLLVLGAAIAVASLWLNTWLMQAFRLGLEDYRRYAAPVVEELLKSGFLIYMIKTRRVGFLVDAVILGFAVGTGFALVENVYYFASLTETNILVWIVRGFGTAVMHGVATAMAVMLSKLLIDRHTADHVLPYVPGLMTAVVIHSFYNHFFISPLVSTVALLVILPLLVAVVFYQSEMATRRWLDLTMDTDAELLEMINSGTVTGSRVGAYLHSLRSRFPGEVVADMLCLLRLHLELSIRAKGVLLMRDAGLPTEPDPEITARFEELKFLEKSIGRTGLLAISPILRMSDREMWQLYMLK